MKSSKIFGIVMGFVLVLTMLGSAYAQECSDLIFFTSQPNYELNEEITVSLEVNNPTSLPWFGNFTNASLSIPSGLVNLSALVVDLSNFSETTQNWDLNSTEENSFIVNANMQNSESGECNYNTSFTVGAVTDPNLTVVSSTLTGEVINIPYTFEVNVTNVGDENATNVVVRLDFLGNSSTTFSPTNMSLGSLAKNGTETKTATFTLNSPESASEVLNVLIDYVDEDSKFSNVKFEEESNYTVSGHSIPTSPDEYLLVGGAKSQQTVNFVENVSQTISSTDVGVNLTLKTTENVSDPEITLAKYSDISSVTSTLPSGKLSASRFLSIDMSTSFETKVSFPAEIKVFYQQTEIDSAGSRGLNEGTLKLYSWNTTSSAWEELTSIVDTSANVLTASTTHFSLFGLFGDENPVPPAASGGGGSSGGSGGGIPSCTDSNYNFGSWSSCSEAGQQSRTGTKTGTCSGAASKTETRSCNFVTPTPQCTAGDFECSDWNACGVDGTQARTCSLKVDANCEGGSAVTSQSCEFTPPEGGELLGGGLSGFFVGRTELTSLSGKAGDSVQFVVEEENHTLTIQEVGNDSVVIWLESEIVRVELKVGDSKAVNINEDPDNDVVVTLVSLEDGVATISVDQLGGAGTGSLAVGAIILIVLILVGLVLYRRRDQDKFKITVKRDV